MCPSEHVHTAVSPGTPSVFDVSIRRTVTLCRNFRICTQHIRSLAYVPDLPGLSSLVHEAVRNRHSVPDSAFLQMLGRRDEAFQLFDVFLRRQSELKMDQVDTAILAYEGTNLDHALSHARRETNVQPERNSG